jgi:hypothetical protein
MTNSLWTKRQSIINTIRPDKYHFFHFQRDASGGGNYDYKNFGRVGEDRNAYRLWIELMLRKDEHVENTNLQDQASYLEDLKESE